jgi:flavin-dependent dehydrogenase
MAKQKCEPDALVLGDHPSAYLAAALLRDGASPLRVCHATIPGESYSNRLCAINPDFFGLHKLLAPLKRKLETLPVHGLKFLSDDPTVRSEWKSNGSAAAHVASFQQVQSALVKIAEDSGVDLVKPRELHIQQVDEHGLHVSLDGQTIRPRLLILGGDLPAAQRKMLGLPGSWEAGVVHRLTFLKLKGTKWMDSSSKPSVVMSLDLRGTLSWAWLTPGVGCVQVAVEQPLEQIGSHPGATMLRHWVEVLARHGELQAVGAKAIDFSAARTMDLPLAGALAQEGVANRTLLIGPAGGFYSACAEDIYPNCWSAVFAAEAARKALKEKHVQDALQIYRHKWGATLGDFLRGPQQNLRFLLPLIYRNPTMTARLAEAILYGKSVVR